MEFIKKVLFHELVSSSFYLLIGSLAANFLAFILNWFLARNLTYVDYGIFASLLSIVNLAIIPASSINLIISKFATKYYTNKEEAELAAFYRLAGKAIFAISIAALLCFSALSIPLSVFLHLDNAWYGIVVAFCISMFYLYSLNLAFLQSILNFGFISFISIFASLIKLTIGIGFVYLGFKAFSGLWGILFMTLGSFIISFFPLAKIISFKKEVHIKLPINAMIKFSVPTFFSALFLTSFTSIDVILVKHFFSAHQAGLYAGLSLIGKVIFYFTAPIPMVMFPLVVKRHTMKQNYKKLFYLAIGLVILPSISITVFYFIRPLFVISIFLGGKDYLSLAPFLGLFGVFLLIFSIANVISNFLFSMGETKTVFAVILFSLLQIFLISFFHSDFYQVIYSSIVSCAILVVVLLTYYLKKFNL